MERTRRDVLGLAGVSVATLAAGCLDDSAAATDEPTETPTDGELPDGLARVDEPPYGIEPEECGSYGTGTPGSDRDPLYLCANMAAEPSLSFTQATTRGSVLADAGLAFNDEQRGDEMFATLLTESADRIADDATGEPVELIRGTEFDTHAVLVVETGWGSGSVYPNLKRVEATDDGVHAFGCHNDPCVRTEDYTSRTAAVRFERPEALDTAVVSLTVAPDERWNVAAGEGVVAIPD